MTSSSGAVGKQEDHVPGPAAGTERSRLDGIAGDGSIEERERSTHDIDRATPARTAHSAITADTGLTAISSCSAIAAVAAITTIGADNAIAAGTSLSFHLLLGRPNHRRRRFLPVLRFAPAPSRGDVCSEGISDQRDDRGLAIHRHCAAIAVTPRAASSTCATGSACLARTAGTTNASLAPICGRAYSAGARVRKSRPTTLTTTATTSTEPS